ncbi:MAG: trypsin-like peptidase domain-containing protein [Candidatus Omnitrophica bacterium]|nr:trypsin-like peptidase domain-containing protein [Candidatus Omnitrophota bacterium]
MEFIQKRCIFPILQYDNVGKPKRFLGTGFFINSEGLFLTAKHVFKDNPLLEDECYKIALDVTPLEVYKIGDIVMSRNYDIAKGVAINISNVSFPRFPDKNIPLNQDVLTLEYSDTLYHTLPSGSTVIKFMSSTRKGNVIKVYHSDYPESIKTLCLELSFPVFRGASGAPVIVNLSWELAGMLVENIERQLMPAHVIKVKNGDKYEEEHQYFMPVGKAIHWSHLKDFAEHE